MGKSIINLFFITIKNVAYHVNTFSEGAMLHNLFSRGCYAVITVLIFEVLGYFTKD